MARLVAAEPVLKAAERWRDECLLGGGSIFTDELLWIVVGVLLSAATGGRPASTESAA